MAESTFTFRVDEDLKAAFAAAAKASDRTAAQVLREAMRDYVTEEASEPSYEEWLNAKVAKSIAQYEAGQFYTDEEMKARMAKFRTEWLNGNAREYAA